MQSGKRQSSSPIISRKSTSPYGSLKASAAKKSILNLNSSGASRKGSKLSQGIPASSDSDKATCGFFSSPLTSQTISLASSKTIRPFVLNVSPFPTNEALIGAFAAVHFRSRAMASSRDELMFLRAAVSLGFERAVALAATHRWKCQRPLRALRAVLQARSKDIESEVLRASQLRHTGGRA